MKEFPTALDDLENDPNQEHAFEDTDIESRMCSHIKRLMLENDAPPEQFERLGLELKDE